MTIGPLLDACLDEALGFAVGAWRIGPGLLGPGTKVVASHPEKMGPIATTVIGEYTVHLYAMALEPSHGTEKEAGGGNGLLVRQKLAAGQAAVVIDAHVQVLPARTPLTLGAVTGDAVTHAVYPSQLLDIKMNHVARAVVFVAHDQRLGLQSAQLVKPQTSQFQRYAGYGQGKGNGDLHGAFAHAAHGRYSGDPFHGHTSGAYTRPRAGVLQGRGTTMLMATQPFVDSLAADPKLPGHLGHPFPFLTNSFYDHLSTKNRGSGILVVVVHTLLLG